jgi:glutathione synthase/RimK-type ligase-like ATP-grasp enzyme
LVQQKKRRNGFQDLPYKNDDVRNWHTGWVYATQDITEPPEAIIDVAEMALDALGLTYGAVDIIHQDTNLYVLEVNTAPGLEGTTLQFYADNFLGLLEEVSNV